MVPGLCPSECFWTFPPFSYMIQKVEGVGIIHFPRSDKALLLSTQKLEGTFLRSSPWEPGVALGGKPQESMGRQAPYQYWVPRVLSLRLFLIGSTEFIKIPEMLLPVTGSSSFSSSKLILAVLLYICLLYRFWDGGLPCNLHSLMDLRKVTDFHQFDQLFLIMRITVYLWELKLKSTFT